MFTVAVDLKGAVQELKRKCKKNIATFSGKTVAVPFVPNFREMETDLLLNSWAKFKVSSVRFEIWKDFNQMLFFFVST